MSFMLAIETSSHPFSVALGQEGRCLTKASGDNLLALVQQVLRDLNAEIEDLDSVAVCTGPGGLGAVRTGVAFANALAWSLNLPIWPVMSFTLLGHTVWQERHMQTLCFTHAADGQCYGGLYDGDACLKAPLVCSFGTLPDVVSKLLSHTEARSLCVAGRRRIDVLAHLETFSDKVALNIEIERPFASASFSLWHSLGSRLGMSSAPILPVNEQTKPFCS